jgi:glycosyltransferase involved in cell wall biosynthesis
VTNIPKILIEGWRFLPHSYALVNQWQLLALMRRGDVELRVRDLPLLLPHWKTMRGVLTPEAETEIASLRGPEDGERFDAVYRICFPFDFTLSDSPRTAVFMTSEYQALPPTDFKEYPNVMALRDDARLSVVTPSHWSAAGCAKLGFAPEQINVIPHGVATDIFRPNLSRREALRRAMNMHGFVFFSTGAMTPNKGMDVLLKAFAAVASKRPEAQLVLKGLDPLYNSGSFLGGAVDTLGPNDQKIVRERTKYVGTSLSVRDLSALYQAADTYVSPYRAEGFNLPVLEAAATGLPIICTEGGATDDFVNAGFTRKIRSQVENIEYQGLAGQQLIPDPDHLIELMLNVMDNEVWRENAEVAGPAQAQSLFSWDSIADKLVRLLLQPASASAS